MKLGFDNGGGTCNAFWSYIPLINKAMVEHGSFIIPIPDRTVQDYPELMSCGWLRFPVRNFNLFGKKNAHFIRKVLQKGGGILCRAFPGLFVSGYDQHRNPISDECKKVVRAIFIPDKSISGVIEKQFTAVRKKADVVIGLHIRRGDYKEWRGGEFFYEFENYAEICSRLKKMFADKAVIFCIASCEDIPADCFSGIDWFQTPDKTPTQDLYALSLCDYIVGPRSSFSKFAAFRGDKPIVFITDRHQEKFTFRKLDDCVTFETGENVDIT